MRFKTAVATTAAALLFTSPGGCSPRTPEISPTTAAPARECNNPQTRIAGSFLVRSATGEPFDESDRNRAVADAAGQLALNSPDSPNVSIYVRGIFRNEGSGDSALAGAVIATGMLKGIVDAGRANQVGDPGSVSASAVDENHLPEFKEILNRVTDQQTVEAIVVKGCAAQV